MDIETRVRQAIAAGEVLKITYEGGSQPGSVREIAPMTIESGKVRAHCYMSGAVKQFSLAKITIVEGDQKTEAKIWQSGIGPTVLFKTLDAFVEGSRGQLLDLGWHIENSQSSVSLHRLRKNGVPLKGYDVSLRYDEYTYDSVLGFDGEVHNENMRKRQRPWTVRANDQVTKSFGALDKAANKFMEWAKQLAPQSPK